MAIGLYQVRHADPYVQQVLALEGDVSRGHAIFELNCAGCHGVFADGKVGPSLRGVAERRSQVGLIHQITSGETPPMPEFQANPQEMADLLSYLNTLLKPHGATGNWMNLVHSFDSMISSPTNSP
jgi:mono/diheme cytochrome c family protein